MTACVVGALSQVSAALGPCHGPGWGWYPKTHGFPGTPSSGGHLYAFAIAFLSRARARFQEYWAAARAVHSPQVAVSRHFRGMPLCIYIQGTARALKPVRARCCTGISTLCPLSCRETRIISPAFTTRLPMHTGSVACSDGNHTCAPPEPAPWSPLTARSPPTRPTAPLRSVGHAFACAATCTVQYTCALGGDGEGGGHVRCRGRSHRTGADHPPHTGV
jgi:hypothetical protein